MNEILIQAIRAALLAGEEILAIYREKDDFSISLKSDNSPVTLADKKAHETILQILAADAPSLPIHSEEDSEIKYSTRRHWSRYWLIDPLDGTREFIQRNDEFTVNIALIEGEDPVLGVIYLPAAGILFFAVKGEGAHKAEQVRGKFNDLQHQGEIIRIIEGASRITGVKTSPLEKRQLTVTVSRSHGDPRSEEFIRGLSRHYHEVVQVPAGSSLKICLVAEGKADLYPRLAPTMEWDIAAGHAIASEAGCRIINFSTGEALRYNKKNLENPPFLVSAPWIMDLPEKFRG